MSIPAPLLSSIPNFRDLGGYRGAGGKPVRNGLIYRSQLIAGATDADKAILHGIRIKYICDLRGEHERGLAPNAWMDTPPPVVSNLNIGMDVRSGASELLEIITADPTAEGIRRMMMKTYSLLPRAFEGKLQSLFDAILSGRDFPFLVHCTAGKDRTGFTCAMILLSLGVSRDDVVHDYMLTEQYLDLPRMMAASAAYLRGIVGDAIVPDDEMLRLLCGTSPDYLESSLAVIERDYGSVETYLEQTAGFDAPKRERLRELMLG